MKEYHYVRVLGTTEFGKGFGFEDHRSIINEYAEDGYSYVGYIPVSVSSHGVVEEIDLIFEKETE